MTSKHVVGRSKIAVVGHDIFSEVERRFVKTSFAWRHENEAPNGVYVLVVRGNEYGVAMRAGDSGNYFESKGGDFSNQIDGWMPLPTPPNPTAQALATKEE